MTTKFPWRRLRDIAVTTFWPWVWSRLIWRHIRFDDSHQLPGNSSRT